MQVIQILFIIVLFILLALVSVGGILLQREKYWIRKWEEMGKPDVNTIKELKRLVKKGT